MTDRDASAPLVSVVVAAKNEERFLRPCLRSIREQWFKPWECVVVDDGSTDGTRQIAEEFAAKDDRFGVVTHTKSKGLGAARNTGIAHSTAPYVTFLDADDFLYQHSLRRRSEDLAGFDAETVAGTYCDWQPTRENQGRSAPERGPADRQSKLGFVHGPECPFIATAPMLRRSVLERFGGFDEALPTAEDFDLWIRILRGGYTFAYSSIIGVAYRQKASGMVFSDVAKHAAASDEIIVGQFEDLRGEPEPPILGRSIADYQREYMRTRRLLRSYALASTIEDVDAAQTIAARVPGELFLLERAGLDVREELLAGVARAARAKVGLATIEARTKLVDRFEAQLRSSLTPHG